MPTLALQLQLQRPDFHLNIHTHIPSQGITALFGASGSGKTTLLRCIAGLERAQGFVHMGSDIWQNDAQKIWLPTHRRRLGFIFQQPNLFPHLSVQDNLQYGLKRVPKTIAENPAENPTQLLQRAIALLGIAALLPRRPATLSGGERQRVAIARALACAPRALLLDEPLSALDGPRKAELLPWLAALPTQFGIPLIYVSHAPEEIAHIAQRVIHLENGHIQREENIADFKKSSSSFSPVLRHP